MDTNVLVSALLTPEGSSARILSLILDEQITLLLDDRILNEYREVLQRPKFHLEDDRVERIVSGLEDYAEYVVASCLSDEITSGNPRGMPDKTDIPFLEVALSGQADALITGNKKDFPKSSRNLKILSPSEFLKLGSK